ncbi:hypothetical protein [Paenibacillus amylolyticus]|uniref:hypothetical protein n=1 Tax=Paenibacillus amylolyticus TaxID=1451 RepID=UPI003EB978CE
MRILINGTRSKTDGKNMEDDPDLIAEKATKISASQVIISMISNFVNVTLKAFFEIKRIKT